MAPRSLHVVRLLPLALSLAILPLLATPSAAQSTGAASAYGKVFDEKTGKPIQDVLVRWTDPAATRSHRAVSDADGSFRIDGLPERVCEFELTRIGYYPKKFPLIATTGAPEPVMIHMEPRAILGPEVEVTTTRVEERGSAVAFTELSHDEIKERYWAQDVPMLLAETPGVYSYSDAGNGVGYSYVKVRGFGQRRVAVTINGIPLNDPQSHEVYWVDHPDLVASAQSIQVQRGVGNALYGASAVGGSINLETTGPPRDRALMVEYGAGSYGTQRFSAQYHSGLLDNTYALTGRFSRVLSDGYRQQSWSSLWSYYFGAARYDSWLTTRLNLYGGPERLHLAYYAVDRAYLDGRITADADEDRRFNPLTWRNETDNFFEPHYELTQDVKLSTRSALTSSIFYFPGKGYYDDLPYGPQSFASRQLPDFTVASNTQYPASYYADTSGTGPYTVVASDMTQRLWVKNQHYGWIPRARFEHAKGELTLGGEWREAIGRHWGELTWSAALPPSTDPNHVFYDYTGRVNMLSVFAQEAFDLRPDLKVIGSLQYRRPRYAVGDDRYNGYNFDLHWDFLNPRAALNWNASERTNVFASYAHTQTEPILTEIYRADDPTAVPLFRVLDPATGTYEDPLVDPETLNDYEFGFGYRDGDKSFRVTTYLLDFTNEIVPNGQISSLGVPITGNAARSQHSGVEIEWSVPHKSGLYLSGNVALSRNRFDDYREYVDSTTVNDYSGNSIAGFPDRIVNFTLGYRKQGATASLTLVETGRQFLDNSEDNRKSPALKDAPGYQHKFVEEHAVLNGALTLDLAGLTRSRPLDARRLALELHAQNLTDLKYETAGYVFAEVPYFYPASGRSVFVSLKAEF